MAGYDEDLTENPFFLKFQQECPELFGQCIAEGWVICVPRVGLESKYTSTLEENFIHHVLIPVEGEESNGQYKTMAGKEVRIKANVVTIENDVNATRSIHILFEETFYTADKKRYCVLCLESSLEASEVGGDVVKAPLVVSSPRDSMDYLWRESGGPKVLELLDEQVQRFLKSHANLEVETLQVQRDLTSALYASCVQVALKDNHLRDKTGRSKSAMDLLKLSVETYVLHGVYKKVMTGVTACTAYDDAHFNKIIRNLSDIQLRDLQVRPDLYDAVPHARQELSQIDLCTTPVGKVGCLRRAVRTITSRAQKHDKEARAVTTDDLLPVLVYLVIRSAVPNWTAQFTFIRDFRFSSPPGDLEESSFYITTLEAALEHVKSGVLLGRSSPEADHDLGENEGYSSPTLARQFSEGTTTTFTKHIAKFFELVQQGKIDEVKAILDQPVKEDKPIETSELCHPLCACDKCEGVLLRNRCDTTPTVHSRDDCGFTALHVASLFGELPLVDLLVDRGSDINASDYRGATSLHYAASRGHQNVLLLLVYANADINAVDNEGNTPLHMASMNGHETCVKAMLYYTENVAKLLDINSASAKGDTALHHAARWGYAGIVEILLDYGADPAIQNGWKMTPLDYAHNIYVSRILAERKPVKRDLKVVKTSPASDTSSSAHKSSVPDDDTWTCISKNNSHPWESQEESRGLDKVFHSIEVGDFHLTCYYLGIEDEENSSTPEISTVTSLCHPLCLCEKCAVAQTMVKRVMRKDVISVDACNSDGITPLHVAAKHGHVNIARVLVKLGANVNAKTWSESKLPLHMACEHNQVEVVQLLLKAESTVNMEDIEGNTPLHYSCARNYRRISSLLLKAGGDFDIRNHEGKTPLEVKLSLAIGSD